MRAPGRKYASRACVQCRKKKRRCDGENCSSCAKENILCVMDLDTDQRRQINRNTRNGLPDRLLSALKTAPVDNLHALIEAARRDATSLELEALLDHLSSYGEDQKMSMAKNAHSPSDLCELAYQDDDWLQIPMNSEMSLNLNHHRPLLVTDSTTFPSRNGVQMADGDRRQFSPRCGSMSSNSKSKTGTLARVMLSFREAACTQIADGARGKDILSMSGLELDLFFRDRIDTDPHSVSAWACEFAKSWTSMPPVSQLAVVYFAAAFMRWYILPCSRTYALMSPMLQPFDVNAMVHDHSEIEHCRAHAVDWIDNLTLNVHQLSWPYTYASCLEESVAAGAAGPPHTRRLSKLFMDYCDDCAKWHRSRDRLNIN